MLIRWRERAPLGASGRVCCQRPVRSWLDIFREGEAANQFYLVREGKLAIEVFAAERGALTILTVGPGEVLGWSWLVVPFRWKFDACDLECTRTIALDGKCLQTKAEQDHHLAYELLRRIAQVMEGTSACHQVAAHERL
jgi:CRP-like cAMP-binding protein